MTLNSFGITPIDQDSIDSSRTNIEKVQRTWQEVAAANVPALGTEGTLLYRLSHGYNSEDTTPLAHLATSAECCVNNLAFLWNLLYDQLTTGQHVPIWAIGSISRSVLISACRILYVLLPESFEDQKKNLDRIHYSNINSRNRYQRASDTFISLVKLKTPFDIVPVPREYRISETEMTEAAVAYVIDYAELRSETQSATANEYLKWMWNSWSGLAHGMEWPTRLPNQSGIRSSALMPGQYAIDFQILSALAYMALDHCRDAFIKQQP